MANRRYCGAQMRTEVTAFALSDANHAQATLREENCAARQCGYLRCATFRVTGLGQCKLETWMR